MASSYTFDQLYGPGSDSQNLTGGTPYTFTITNNSGSSYFTMETVRDYSGTTPKNTSGSLSSLTNIASYNQSDYITGFSLPVGTNSFVFTPATTVTGTTLKLRGTGGIILSISP